MYHNPKNLLFDYAECEEAFLKGKAPYSCINQFRSAIFHIEIIIYVCYKTGNLNESREAFLKGKAPYGWLPCANQFRSAIFYIEIIIYVCYITSYRNEELNGT